MGCVSMVGREWDRGAGMKTYNSVDDMVKDLGSEGFYHNWKRPSWHKFKNWWSMWYMIIRYRIMCLIHGDVPIVVDDEMAEVIQSITDKIEESNK